MKDNRKNQEAFVYIWRDSRYNKYYLGYHTGTPDDDYTHSSTVMEEFKKDNIPSYMKRRILTYGTTSDMEDLEIKLLTNRKERGKWDRYYNVKWWVRPIGDARKYLTEEQQLEWRQKMSGPRGPQVFSAKKQWLETMTEEERKERFGHPGETAFNWKGGISLGDNLKGYQEKNYKERKELCFKLMEQGLTYYEIKEQYPNALIGYPYPLLPKEEKEKLEKRNKVYQLKNRKHECYCRQYECDYCGPLMIEKHGTKEEVLERKRQKDVDRYYRDRSDPVKLTHKRKVSKAWEEKNKEKRRAQKRVWHKAQEDRAA